MLYGPLAHGFKGGRRGEAAWAHRNQQSTSYFYKPKFSGYILSMPTVLRRDGFDVMIYTHDHAPAHVHVWKARVGNRQFR